jgi:hypothetical protein
MTDQNVLAPETKTEAPAEEKKNTRRKFRNDAWTEEAVETKRKALTVETLPEGYVSMASMDKLCRQNSIPVSKLVRATGGDRGMNPPLDPVFQIVFCKGSRWMPGEAAVKGLELLKSDEFAKSPRKPREPKAPKEPKEKKVKSVKAEGDGETGPVKSAKPARQTVVVRPTPGGMNPVTPKS